MSLQYLSNEKGEITAVQVPIHEWERIKSKYPDVDHADSKLPDWHKEIIDSRLDALNKEPDKVRPISDLMDELDK
jgi:hypothetical protein